MKMRAAAIFAAVLSLAAANNSATCKGNCKGNATSTGLGVDGAVLTQMESRITHNTAVSSNHFVLDLDYPKMGEWIAGGKVRLGVMIKWDLNKYSFNPDRLKVCVQFDARGTECHRPPMTDRDGAYTIAGMPAGEHQLTLQLVEDSGRVLATSPRRAFRSFVPTVDGKGVPGCADLDTPQVWVPWCASKVPHLDERWRVMMHWQEGVWDQKPSVLHLGAVDGGITATRLLMAGASRAWVVSRWPIRPSSAACRAGRLRQLTCIDNVSFSGRGGDFAVQVDDAIQIQPDLVYLSVYREECDDHAQGPVGLTVGGEGGRTAHSRCRATALPWRDRLLAYALRKARTGVLFEGGGSHKIDTIPYYNWVFKNMGVQGVFFGYASSGKVDVPKDGPEHTRPIFFISATDYDRTHYDAFVAAGTVRVGRGSHQVLEARVKELEEQLRIKDVQISVLTAKLQHSGA